MLQIDPIDDAYIDSIIYSSQVYNPNLSITQGIRLRELIKQLRDRSEQQTNNSFNQIQHLQTIVQAAGSAVDIQPVAIPFNAGSLAPVSIGNYQQLYSSFGNYPHILIFEITGSGNKLRTDIQLFYIYAGNLLDSISADVPTDENNLLKASYLLIIK